MTTKLLAVDDSKTMRRVLDITLNGDGFQTTICGSAAEALQAIRADKPTVALVDAALGAESGYELCRRIKAEAPDVRVLILSSKHRPYDEGQGSSAGADGNFDKPFDSQKLIDKVQGLVGSAPAPRAAAPVAASPAAAAPPVAAPPVAAPPVAAPPAPARAVSAGPRPVAPAPIAASPAAPTVSAATPAAAPRPAAAPSPAASASRAPIAPARPPVTPGTPSVAARPHAPAPIAAPVAPSVVASGASSAAFADKLKHLGLSTAQVEGVLALSREVVEQVVWEVVPVLAESMIKEEIARLTAE